MASFRAAALGALAVAAVVAAGSVPRKGPLGRGQLTETIYAPEGLDLGEPLILTGLSPAEVKALAPVSIGNVTSYAGYFTVNGTSSLFTWYFPNPNASAPTIIWLQGGPGGSSLFGLFTEVGPFYLDADLNLYPRATSWCNFAHCLFVDNPRGTGYSQTPSPCTTWQCYADDLDDMIRQFLGAFPEVATNPFYLTGESYAGHYISATAATILRNNAAGSTPSIPLAGASIGDGWIDPVNMVPAYPDLLFNLGLVDEAGRGQLLAYCVNITSSLAAGDSVTAFRTWDTMLNGDLYPYPNLFFNLTHLADYDNFLADTANPVEGYFAEYVTQPAVRQALHVGSNPFNSGLPVEMALVPDIMASQAENLEFVLNSGLPVLIYSGQLDIIVAAALTENFLRQLPWAGQADYLSAPRTIWSVNGTNGIPAGYVRVARNLAQVVVRGAGHILPLDQPVRGYDMVTRFIFNKGWN